MSLPKLESIVLQAKVLEKTFPTISELILLIKDSYKEMDSNEFELLKKHMINALYQRFEVKIDFQDNITNPFINLSAIEIYKQYRVLIDRVNVSKLNGNNKDQMEEMLNIFRDSFTLRDLRNRFVDSQNNLRIDASGLNTVQFYKQLNKVALKINSIPYED